MNRTRKIVIGAVAAVADHRLDLEALRQRGAGQGRQIEGTRARAEGRLVRLRHRVQA